ncbi:MAG TPA: hypothetical protein DD381_10575 [Lentisphaeria bacterium]|nr:MAG: hypothetical protein A2X47_02095 [Lentisphaerae bacterium GWF2_38_69]HBM16771.1 hypothetical protein [Lentisphaeria bacterium]
MKKRKMLIGTDTASLKSFLILILMLFLPLLLSSCGTTENSSDNLRGEGRKDKLSELDFEADMNHALFSFGKMLEAYDVAPLSIQIQNTGDTLTDKVIQNNVSILISNAVKKFDHTITLIPAYPQNSINENASGDIERKTYPDVIISGGFSGLENQLKRIDNQSTSKVFRLAGSTKDSSSLSTGEQSEITLELNLKDYKTNSFFPGVFVSDYITPHEDGEGWDIHSFDMDYNASFYSVANNREGVCSAVKYLLDLGIVELLGRYFSVPYWKCIKGASVDTKMVQLVNDRVKGMSDENLIAGIKKYLYLSGIKNINRSRKTLSFSEKKILAEQMKIHAAKDYPSLLVILWENLPVEKALKVRTREKQNELRKQKQMELGDIGKAIQEQRKLLKKEIELNNLSAAAQKRYDDCIREADKLYSAGDLVKAYKKYNESLSYIPDDKYATSQMDKAKSFMESAVKTENDYKAAIDTADNAYKAKDYTKALQFYKQALVAKQSDIYALKMIARINNL